MASLKAEKPVGSQSAGSVKKAPVSKAAPPKNEQKPREPRKKGSGTKPVVKK